MREGGREGGRQGGKMANGGRSEVQMHKREEEKVRDVFEEREEVTTG